VEEQMKNLTSQVNQNTTTIAQVANDKTRLTDELLNAVKEKERLQHQAYKNDIETIETAFRHRQEKDELIRSGKQKDQEMKKMQNEHHETLQKIDKDVEQLIRVLGDSQKENTTLREKNKQSEEEIEKLKEKQRKDRFIFEVAVAILTSIIGVLIALLLKNTPNSISQQTSENKQKMGRYAIPYNPDIGSQTVIHSGIQTITSGVLSSGLSSYHTGDSMNFEHNHVAYSGTSPTIYGGSNHSGVPVISNYTEAVIPTIDNNDVSFVTDTSGDPRNGVYYSSHLETFGFTPQVQIPLFAPTLIPSFNIPQYSYCPVPNELLLPGTNIWIPITGMTWFQFVVLIEWIFQRLGYKVTRLKLSHDKGGDILIERDGARLIIQVKHRKKHTGTIALMEVFWAKFIYGATKARVISYSPFTTFAKKDAPIANIELWDLNRLLTELHNYGIYYPIE
jgi:hypothetical protein